MKRRSFISSLPLLSAIPFLNIRDTSAKQNDVELKSNIDRGKKLLTTCIDGGYPHNMISEIITKIESPDLVWQNFDWPNHMLGLIHKLKVVPSGFDSDGHKKLVLLSADIAEGSIKFISDKLLFEGAKYIIKLVRKWHNDKTKEKGIRALCKEYDQYTNRLYKEYWRDSSPYHRLFDAAFAIGMLSSVIYNLEYNGSARVLSCAWSVFPDSQFHQKKKHYADLIRKYFPNCPC